VSKAEKIVERLEFCKQVSGNRWIARCPAHDDRSPSLSITQVNDGRVLIHCHAGCGGNDILTSIGLEWADLYPDDDNYSPLVKRRVRDSYNDLVVGIAEARAKEGHRLSEEDKRIVLQAKLKRLAG